MADKTSEPPQATLWPDCSFRPFKRHPRKEFEETRVHPDDAVLQNQLSTIYDMSTTAAENRNTSWWAGCCPAYLRYYKPAPFGHPQHMLIKMKDILTANNIKTEKQFKEYMCKTLPKNKEGLIILPQINMMHPRTAAVKNEEKEACVTSKIESEISADDETKAAEVQHSEAAASSKTTAADPRSSCQCHLGWQQVALSSNRR